MAGSEMNQRDGWVRDESERDGCVRDESERDDRSRDERGAGRSATRSPRSEGRRRPLHDVETPRCRDVEMSRRRDVAMSIRRDVAMSRRRDVAMSRCRDASSFRDAFTGFHGALYSAGGVGRVGDTCCAHLEGSATLSGERVAGVQDALCNVEMLTCWGPTR
eukprot:gene13537-biopygen6959